MGNQNEATQSKKEDDEIPLIQAAKSGNIDLLTTLLKDEALNVDVTNHFELTPLAYAARNGYEDCVRALLSAEARIDGLGRNKTSTLPTEPIHLAVRNNRANCVKALIDAGCDVDISNNRIKKTPLHIACHASQQECIELLVSARCDVNSVDAYGNTPLFTSCFYCHDGHDILKILLNAGADVNQVSKRYDQYSPLHICAYMGRYKSIEYLLKSGADVNVMDREGLRPVDKAEKCSKSWIILKSYEEMEVSVRAVETSDGKISVEKSSNGESKDAIERSGEKRSNKERKESENNHSHSTSNEFSLERKISFKELRKRADEMEDAPNLSSRQGQVSLVLESKEKVDNAKNKREEKNHPEGNAKQEPGNLHLSQIEITQWIKPNGKQSDEEASSRLKQICSTLEGDVMYHYENVDDFDDTSMNYQPKCKHSKKSPLPSPPKQHISCKYKFDENGDGMVTKGVSCKGSPDERPHEMDLRLYFIGEFARKAETIRCLQRGCDNLYDPWDVLEFAGTKKARTWFLNDASDPLDRKHPTALPPITHKHSFPERPYTAPSGPTDEKDFELIAYWLKGESKSTKFKFFKLPKTIAFRKSVKANDRAMNRARAQMLLEYKHVCATCCEGTNEEPEPGGPTCGHYDCKPCLRHYFVEKMKKSVTRMECPHLGCHERFRKSFIISVLDFIPLRVVYGNLYEKNKEMGNAGSTSNSSSEENQEFQITPKVANSSPNESKTCLKSNGNCKKCPRCNAPSQKCADDEACNIVLCGFCRKTFCWICEKKCSAAFHVYKCPLYGKRKFSTRRRISNFVGYSAGFAIGVPMIGSLVVGTSAVALATLVVLGALSPPVLLARKMNKLHTSSATRRRICVLGGASLGVLALPVLSAWGVYKTVVIATRKAEEIFCKCLPAEDDEDFSHQTLKVDTVSELTSHTQRDTTNDENTKDDHIQPN